jgi:hypothetical protein
MRIDFRLSRFLCAGGGIKSSSARQALYIVALMNADFAIAPSRRATHSLARRVAVNSAVVARSHQKSSKMNWWFDAN